MKVVASHFPHDFRMSAAWIGAWVLASKIYSTITEAPTKLVTTILPLFLKSLNGKFKDDKTKTFDQSQCKFSRCITNKHSSKLMASMHHATLNDLLLHTFIPDATEEADVVTFVGFADKRYAILGHFWDEIHGVADEMLLAESWKTKNVKLLQKSGAEHPSAPQDTW